MGIKGDILLIIILFFIFLMFLSKRIIKNFKKLNTYLFFILILVILREGFEYLFDFNNKTIGLYFITVTFLVIKILGIFLDETSYKIIHFEIPKLLRSVILIVIFIVSFFFALKKYYNINLTPFLTTSAILSAVIGLALQDTLTNFIAGIVLTSEKNFKRGDSVVVDNIEGKVNDTDWRSTKITKFGGGVVSIPNSILLKDKFINYYRKSKYRIDIEIGTSYNDPPNKVIKVLLEIAKNNKKVLKDPLPEVLIRQYGDFSIDYILRIWVVDDYLNRWSIKTDIYREIWYSFLRNGIKIPFPVRENIEIIKDVKEENKQEFENRKVLINKIEFLKSLSEKSKNELSKKIRVLRYGKGEIIVKEGEEGDSFFIIQSGIVDIFINNRKIANLKKGDFFGEMSLLTGNKRNATVVATTDLELLVLDKMTFRKIIENDKAILDILSEYLLKRGEENTKFNKDINDLSKKQNTNRADIKKSIFKKLINFFEF
ncbi:cyclic nucleotide-binding protein [Hypnocyclicus thermotrophus]|uniref:Cyclic nucleotide-binding protein n=1 Tax=Hypnocyclicus thermotrophus TaxID=1627895 RepID=A0AA46DZG9_9FUSO|nr:mechanosensitive ion channel family protein [Hypnocyclicus thermotrophus]TDT71590.1 cyclic nucleotide-binding protein [Hypnocyclicus thermotrophus]